MRMIKIAYCVLISALALLQGCAATLNGTSNIMRADASAVRMITEADPELDHVIAMIPLEKAQTASVAEALVHIALVNSKEQVGQSQCRGALLLNGAITHRVGPYLIPSPSHRDKNPLWYYRISYTPGLQGCTQTVTPQLYRELNEKLPDWMIVKTASYGFMPMTTASLAR